RPVSEMDDWPTGRRRPAPGVGNHAQDVRVVIDRVGFVTGTGVEDLAPPTVKTTTAAKNLAALKPADQDKLIRLWNVEMLAVDLGLGYFEPLGNPGGDRMGGSDDPDALLFTGLSPFEVAGGAHEPREDPGKVGRVRHDKAHTAGNHALVNALDDLAGDAIVSQMAPPDQHVGVSQHRFGEAMLWLFQGRRAHVEAFPAEERGDCAVHTVRIDGSDRFLGDFVQVLVPDSHAEGISHVPPRRLGLPAARVQTPAGRGRQPTPGWHPRAAPSGDPRPAAKG